MKQTSKIIKEKVESLYVQSLIKRKGWTEQDAADYVLEFILSGTKLSFHDFMEAKDSLTFP